MGARYLVIEVGCLECADKSCSEPTIKLATDKLSEAAIEALHGMDTRSFDRFIVDSLRGSIIDPHES